MSDSIGTYTFLPWVRSGIANRLEAAAAGARARVNVALAVDGALKDGSGTTSVPVSRDVELYGPGDIIGVDAAQISRREPPHWTTNFEPNYLVAIEFYDEDFPWRYTPALPEGRKLLPWLALIVLEEGKEIAEVQSVEKRPLSAVEVQADFSDVFPDSSETWAWAHAHFNADFSPNVLETDAALAGREAQQMIAQAPDRACSRLLCPRKLKPKTGYHVLLVPAFESGRLAGLGHDPKPLFEDAANGLSATSPSWGAYGVAANRPDPTLFPVYQRWYFRTADNGDFESLVRLLKPQVVDSRVGHRDIDVTDPAPNVVGIHDPALGGVLRLGGALRAPLAALSPEERSAYDTYDRWAEPYPHAFQSQLAAFVNLAEGYQASGPAANADAHLSAAVQGDPDPMITPPLYGRWHALTERLLTNADGSDAPHRTNWVHDLNLDPRWRAAAGMGTEVVQKNQETYMEAAWNQVGDVLEANRRIRQAQLAKAAGRFLHEAHIQRAASVSPASVLWLTAPVKARVSSQGLTLRHRMTQSASGVTLTSAALRRALRPSARLARRVSVGTPSARAELLTRANAGAVSAAPPRVTPNAVLTPDAIAGAVAPPASAETSWLRWVFFGLLLLLLRGALGWLSFVPVLLLARRVWSRIRRGMARQAVAGRIREDNLRPATVDRMPGSRSFTLAQDVDPRKPPPRAPVAGGEIDNDEAQRFKNSLRDQYRLIDVGKKLGEVPAAVPLELPRVASDVVAALNPELTVPRWTLSGLTIPERIREQIGTAFVEVMAYPEIDVPMYEPLATPKSELLVPNLHLVPPESVTLLETNQRFIEAYMVGLNHEFARELLWREFPTDQRGTYFRQFWDVRKKLAAAADPVAAREALRDIKPLHRWRRTSDLGDNDNRETGSEAEEELVLVIRGELLKKYPHTIITAQRAKWQLTNGEVDKSKERVLDDSQPPIEPLYEARVAPDIYFFGFDLTAREARGDDTVDDAPGWFFRIEEVPGDARFGFDIARASEAVNVWNDLAWPDVMPGLADGAMLRVASIPSRGLVEPTGPLVEKHEQWTYDQHVPLDANVSSAELAYVALQTPVLMAVHASELLPNQGS